ncbi:MAG: HAD hydrolase-like protein [Draconibacterium sp.]
MSRFTHIIFDLDGTLTDNTLGISNAVSYALRKMNVPECSDEIVRKFIGPPIQWSFKNHFGMNEREVALAVDFFREYFNEKGWCENEPYPGVNEMLEELHASGKKLYLATAKLEKFAERILLHFGFDKYIIGFVGADYNGHKAEKDALIASLLEKEQISASEKVVMVGDTIFDIEGGKANVLSTVAVFYGFGEPEALRATNPDFQAESVEELFEVLNF